MIGLAVVAGLFATYEAGASAGVGGVDGRLTLLATPWAGAQGEAFGIALQAPLRYVPDSSGLRAEDWDRAADFGRVLRFARFQEEADPFALRLGVLSRRTLGHGTLVRRYHNGVDDDRYRTGASAHVRGDAFEVRALADHVLGPPVVAARAVARVTDFLEVGATFAGDTRAPALDGEPGAHGWVPGYGAEVSLLTGIAHLVHVTPYLDVNRVDESDLGVHVGMTIDYVGGDSWQWGVRGEYLYAGERYDWAWFDTLYLVERAARPAFRPGAAHGGRGGFEVSYAQAASLGVEFADAEGPGRADLSAWLEIPTDQVELSAFYARRHVAAFGDLFDPSESVAAAALRKRLSRSWSLVTALARAWRATGPDGLAPVTEASLTVEAVVP